MDENPFISKFFKTPGTSLQLTNFGGDIAPTHSLLSEGLTDGDKDKGEDYFTTHLDDLTETNNKFSELNPPENSAQRWEKLSIGLKKTSSDHLDPEKEATGKYFHLYNDILGESKSQGDIESISDTGKAPNIFTSSANDGVAKDYISKGQIVDENNHEAWEHDPNIPEYQKRAAARNRGGETLEDLKRFDKGSDEYKVRANLVGKGGLTIQEENSLGLTRNKKGSIFENSSLQSAL